MEIFIIFILKKSFLMNTLSKEEFLEDVKEYYTTYEECLSMEDYVSIVDTLVTYLAESKVLDRDLTTAEENILINYYYTEIMENVALDTILYIPMYKIILDTKPSKFKSLLTKLNKDEITYFTSLEI